MSTLIFIPLVTRKHIYKLTVCSGCEELITGSYKEIGLPSSDGQNITHIALCSNCSDIANQIGLLW